MNRSEVEKISKALADKTRLRIFEAISATNRMNCGDIVSMRGVTPATVSHHLKVLSEAKLITCQREGQFVYITKPFLRPSQPTFARSRKLQQARRQRAALDGLIVQGCALLDWIEFAGSSTGRKQAVIRAANV